MTVTRDVDSGILRLLVVMVALRGDLPVPLAVRLPQCCMLPVNARSRSGGQAWLARKIRTIRSDQLLPVTSNLKPYSS